MKLRKYHNPKKIDESKVPTGWRFRYADEMSTKAQRCRYWGANAQRWQKARLNGLDPMATYIVPVNPS
jgi:hypothetical protein